MGSASSTGNSPQTASVPSIQNDPITASIENGLEETAGISLIALPQDAVQTLSAEFGNEASRSGPIRNRGNARRLALMNPRPNRMFRRDHCAVCNCHLGNGHPCVFLLKCSHCFHDDCLRTVTRHIKLCPITECDATVKSVRSFRPVFFNHQDPDQGE